jgi:hypothetical protein
MAEAIIDSSLPAKTAGASRAKSAGLRAREESDRSRLREDVRVNLSFPASQEAYVDRLCEVFGNKSRPALFELALTVLSWAESEMENGRPIGSYDSKTDTFRELAIPGYMKHRKLVKPVSEVA